jgi:hypothetical protein
MLFIILVLLVSYHGLLPQNTVDQSMRFNHIHLCVIVFEFVNIFTNNEHF